MFLMQARSSTTGEMVSWSSEQPDWTGEAFPGPGAPEHIAATRSVDEAPPSGLHAKHVAAPPTDADFTTPPAPGSLAIDTTTGLLYFRTHTNNTWAPVLAANQGAVAIPGTSLTFPVTGSPVIRQAGASGRSGSHLTIQAQSTGAGFSGGSLYLYAGSGGSEGSEGAVYFGAGGVGVQLRARRTGQSLYSVVPSATSVLFRQESNPAAGVTGAWFTVQAQDAPGPNSTGGDLILTSGSGTTSAGKTRLQAGGIDFLVGTGQGNVALLSGAAAASTFGGGVGVMYWRRASTPPTSNPTSGIIPWVDDADDYTLKYRKPSGEIVQVRAGYTGTRVRIREFVIETQTSSAGPVDQTVWTAVAETAVAVDFVVTMARQGAVTKASTYKGSATYRKTGAAANPLADVPPAYQTPEQETVAADGATFVVTGDAIQIRLAAGDADPRNWTIAVRVQEQLSSP